MQVFIPNHLLSKVCHLVFLSFLSILWAWRQPALHYQVCRNSLKSLSNYHLSQLQLPITIPCKRCCQRFSGHNERDEEKIELTYSYKQNSKLSSYLFQLLYQTSPTPWIFFWVHQEGLEIYWQRLFTCLDGLKASLNIRACLSNMLAWLVSFPICHPDSHPTIRQKESVQRPLTPRHRLYPSHL